VTQIDIPAAVKYIGDGCFFGADLLEIVTFMEITSHQLRRIGARAFMWTALRVVELPPGLETIEEDAFYCCHTLTTVTFGVPSSLVEIGPRAFFETALVEVTIPLSVVRLGKSAFSIPTLKKVTFDPGTRLTQDEIRDAFLLVM
jgi:hypothetical protein